MSRPLSTGSKQLVFIAILLCHVISQRINMAEQTEQMKQMELSEQLEQSEQSCTTNISLKDYPITIEPNQVTVDEGQSLTLSCQIQARCRIYYNSSSLYFWKNVAEFAANSSRVVMKSEYEITLTIPEVRHWRDRGAWMCCMQGLDKQLIPNTAFIEFKNYPTTPVISDEDCVVNNCEVIECKWRPSYSEQDTKNLKYQLLYSTGLRSHGYCCADSRSDFCDSNLRDSSCRLPLNLTSADLVMGRVYNLTVRAMRLSAFKTAQLINYNTTDHVKPSAPKGLQMAPLNTSHYQVTWSRPDITWSGARDWIFNYSLVISTKYQEDTVFTPMTSYVLHILPHVSYNLSVRVRPQHAGYWSDITSYHVITKPSAPERNPEVTSVGYDVIDRKCAVVCDIRVYWKPLSEWQLAGPNFRYRVIARHTESDLAIMQEITDLQTGMSQIRVDAHGPTEVLVEAMNDIGSAPLVITEAIIVDPELTADGAEARLVLETNMAPNESAKYKLRAFVPDETDEKNCTITVFWRVKQITDTTWTPNDWTTLSRDSDGIQSAAILLDQPPDHFTFYVTSARVLDGRMRSGGLSTYSDCVYTNGPGMKVLPPGEPKVTQASKTTMTLEWWAPRCDADVAYVGMYHVYYCEASHTNCDEPVRIVDMPVSADLRTLTITDLKPDTYYLIHMSSESYHGNIISRKVQVQGHSRTEAGVAPWLIAVLSAVGVIVVVIMVFGVRVYWRGCVKIRRWYKSGIAIQLPDDLTAATHMLPPTVLLSEISVDSGCDVGATQRNLSQTDSGFSDKDATYSERNSPPSDYVVQEILSDNRTFRPCGEAVAGNAQTRGDSVRPEGWSTSGAREDSEGDSWINPDCPNELPRYYKVTFVDNPPRCHDRNTKILPPIVTSATQDGYVTSATHDGYVTSATQDGYVTSVTQDGYVTSATQDGDMTRVTQDSDAIRVTHDDYVTSATQDSDMTRVTQDNDATRVTQDGYVTRVTQDSDATRVTQDGYVTRVTQDSDATRVTQDGYVTRVTQDNDATRVTQDIDLAASYIIQPRFNTQPGTCNTQPGTCNTQPRSEKPVIHNPQVFGDYLPHAALGGHVTDYVLPPGESQPLFRFNSNSLHNGYVCH